MSSGGFTVWFTGLPCSGKTTLAYLLQKELEGRDLRVEVLDGDEVRQRLTKGLGYTKEDRDENVRRIAYVAKLLNRVGAVAIISVISPYRAIRERVRSEIPNFVEVYLQCPVEVCIRRDVKGLYQRALLGEISHFTGISDPYEPPVNPEVVLRTDLESPEASLKRILTKLIVLGFLSPSESARKS